MLNENEWVEVNSLNGKKETPLLTVSNVRATFGVGVIRLLGNPEYAKVLVNQKEHSICVVACSKDDVNGFRFCRNNIDQYVHIYTIKLRTLLNRLAELSEEDYPYSVIGTLDQLSNGKPCAIFNIKNAIKKHK